METGTGIQIIFGTDSFDLDRFFLKADVENDLPGPNTDKTLSAPGPGPIKRKLAGPIP
jgi:hypothetical protein